jgi:hypothetical protein
MGESSDVAPDFPSGVFCGQKGRIMKDTGDYQFDAASPLMTAASKYGLDVQKIIEGDSAEVAKAHGLGIPVPGLATAGAAQVTPAVQSALATAAPGASVGTNTPEPTGSSAKQPQAEMAARPAQDNTPYAGFGNSLAAGAGTASQQPSAADAAQLTQAAQAAAPHLANAAQAAAPILGPEKTNSLVSAFRSGVQGQAPAAGGASVPSTISPTGSAQNPTSGGNTVQEGVITPTIPGTSTPATSPQDSSGNTLQWPLDKQTPSTAAAAPGSAGTTPATDMNKTLNPLDPAYRPTKWQRVGRGVVGGLVGAGKGAMTGNPLAMIGGAVSGTADPGSEGATPYSAPNRQFSVAAQQRALQIQNAATNAETELKQAQAKAAGMIRVTPQAAIDNPALKPYVNLDLPASVFKTIGASATKVQGQEEVAGTNAGERAASQGLKSVTGADGKTTYVEDPDSPVTKAKHSMVELRDAQTELAQANAALAKAKNDPNSPVFKAAQQRAATAALNANAATVRAQAYALNAMAGNLGIDLHGNQIEGGATTAEGKPIGSRFATPYIKQEGKTAQFNDVLGATDRIESTAERLVNSGKRLNDPSVAAAIADPKTTSMQWAQGAFATSGLTPEQRDYVTNVKAYKENLQALRQASGGGFSDAQVNRLMEMAPGANTPDLDYLKRQTGQIRLTANRLAQGLPTMRGGHTVEGSGNTPAAKTAASTPPPGATHAYTNKSGAVVGYAVNGKYQAVK